MKQCCGTCKYHQFENVNDGYVCVNSDSEYCADWTEYSDCCEEWEESDERQIFIPCKADKWC